jgi:hypothetical protein
VKEATMLETPTRPVFTTPTSWPRAGAIRFVDVPERRLLMLDGIGHPTGQAFQAAIGALFGTAYTLRFALKRRAIDTKVGHLEALWSRLGDPLELDLEAAQADPSAWAWTALIELPDEAADDDIAAAMTEASKRRPSSAFAHLRVERWREGEVVETLHVGPYATEPETVARMLAVAAEAGLRPTGAHHEIYLGDPHRSAPEKLRTVLRQPVG